MKSYRCFIAWHVQQSIETLCIDSADSTKWLGEFLPAKRHCFFIVHFDADQCEKNEWTMWPPWEMGSTHVVKSGRWFLISQVITLNMPHAQKPCEIWFLLIHEGRAVEGLIAVSKGSSEHVWNAYILDSYPGPSFSWEAVATVSSMLGWVLEWWAAPATWGSLLLALS